jgi:hypothetical protein
VVLAREHLLADYIQADRLISGSFALECLGEALQRLTRGEGLQYAIDPWV